DNSDAATLASVDAMTPNQKTNQPRKSAATAESAADVSGVYVVKSGDSLDKIAREHGVTVQQIQRWNSLRSSRIMPGDELVVYPVVKEVESARAKSLADARATSAGKSKHIIYVVRKGDTVWQIAQQYDVQESQIREWNSLNRSGRIYAGQELIIKKETN
ncbi:LysM peptidoglycan-binding domain-containing protein, partial [Sphingobacteriales bacterium CHB3]|nr:LysM peptidoglycan-binding domain-containing protein [Sphingobacteriales bacterium CHB3]